MANKDMNCSLTFHENQHGIFESGETMYGAVTLNIFNKINIRNVTLKLSGKGKTDWYTGAGERVHHKGKEIFLNAMVCVVGEKGGPEFQLLPGTHIFNFACELPINLPSSVFDSLYGFIDYTIVINIDRPFKFDDHFNVGFTIVKPLDLNLMLPEIGVRLNLIFLKKNLINFIFTVGL